MRFFSLVLCSVCLSHSLASGASDWPQFRGPDGNGEARAKRVPLQWSETNNIAWKIALPGRGRSSPVVAGNRVWLTLATERGVVRKRIEGDDMQTAEHVALDVLCFDARDGKLLWRTNLWQVEHPDPVHWLNSWATPTPVVDDRRLFCDFGTYGTACLDSKSGKVLWTTRIPQDHHVGPGSSPVLHGKTMIMVRDGRDAQFVVALDRTTGREVWRTNRPPLGSGSGNAKKSFVTPLLVKVKGQTELISPGSQWIVAYDPATGDERWRARHGSGFSIGSGPVFDGLTVYFSTGCMKPQLVTVRADGSGDVTATHLGWRSNRQVPVMSSLLRCGDELYWVSDDGMATCANRVTGEPFWQERLGQQHLASPLLAEGRVYFFGLEGKSTVIKAGQQHEKLAENPLDGTVVGTPAVVDGAIFLRTDTHLYRIGKR